MRAGYVYNNQILAGVLQETAIGFAFTYDTHYLLNENHAPICLAMPKQAQAFESKTLFPFFYNMISEGANKKIQSRYLKIDEEDAFGFLLQTASHETIGAIRVEPKIIDN
jgi:HipA-like protein